MRIRHPENYLKPRKSFNWRKKWRKTTRRERRLQPAHNWLFMANKKKRKIEVPQAKVSKSRTNRWKILLPAVAVIALGISVFFYFRTPRKIQSGAFKDLNLLMITLDTTRADHLPMYGYKQVKTPNLDALARESYIFEDAIAHAPLTLPSHASMLTGLLPINHGIRD